MFQTVCQIGPLNILTYGAIVAAIVALGCVLLIVIARSGGDKRKAISVVLFWALVFAVVMMVPLFTSVTIYSYGLMLAIAVIVSTLMLVQEARRYNIKSDIIFDLVFWAVIGGILGARLFYILLNYPYFIQYPNEMIMIQKGGLAWQGGLIFGALFTVSFIKAKELLVSKTLDLLVPYLALGQSIGRIGCFLNGCCFGREVSWGIYFPVHDATLHPTQLYLAGVYFLIFILLTNLFFFCLIERI